MKVRVRAQYTKNYFLQEKTIDLPLKMNMAPVPSNNTQAYSQLMHQVLQN